MNILAILLLFAGPLFAGDAAAKPSLTGILTKEGIVRAKLWFVDGSERRADFKTGRDFALSPDEKQKAALWKAFAGARYVGKDDEKQWGMKEPYVFINVCTGGRGAPQQEFFATPDGRVRVIVHDNAMTQSYLLFNAPELRDVIGGWVEAYRKTR